MKRVLTSFLGFIIGTITYGVGVVWGIVELIQWMVSRGGDVVDPINLNFLWFIGGGILFSICMFALAFLGIINKRKEFTRDFDF